MFGVAVPTWRLCNFHISSMPYGSRSQHKQIQTNPMGPNLLFLYPPPPPLPLLYSPFCPYLIPRRHHLSRRLCPNGKFDFFLISITSSVYQVLRVFSFFKTRQNKKEWPRHCRRSKTRVSTRRQRLRCRQTIAINRTRTTGSCRKSTSTSTSTMSIIRLPHHPGYPGSQNRTWTRTKRKTSPHPSPGTLAS